MLHTPEPDYDPSSRIDDAIAQAEEEALREAEMSADPDLSGELP